MRPHIDPPWIDTGSHACEDCGDETCDAICPDCANERNRKAAMPFYAAREAANFLRLTSEPQARAIAEELRQIAQVCVLSDDAGVRSMGERANGLAEALDRSRDVLALAESVAWK